MLCRCESSFLLCYFVLHSLIPELQMEGSVRSYGSHPNTFIYFFLFLFSYRSFFSPSWVWYINIKPLSFFTLVPFVYFCFHWLMARMWCRLFPLGRSSLYVPWHSIGRLVYFLTFFIFSGTDPCKPRTHTRPSSVTMYSFKAVTKTSVKCGHSYVLYLNPHTGTTHMEWTYTHQWLNLS